MRLTTIIAVTTALVVSTGMGRNPNFIDHCSRHHDTRYKTLTGKCNEARSLQRVERDRAAPSKPDKPNRPDRPSRPDKPDRNKGNASANNGKGGNYDRTGHSDNGKGNGRNKK